MLVSPGRSSASETADGHQVFDGRRSHLNIIVVSEPVSSRKERAYRVGGCGLVVRSACTGLPVGLCRTVARPWFCQPKLAPV